MHSLICLFVFSTLTVMEYALTNSLRPEIDGQNKKYFTSKVLVTVMVLLSTAFLIIISSSKFISLDYLFPRMFKNSVSDNFDNEVAKLAVKLCAYSICSPDSYLSIDYKLGENIIFKPTYKVLGKSDINGYIGYISSLKFICIVFRGSVSEANWIADLKFGFANYPKCQGCQVHEGFYETEQSIVDSTTKEVARLLQLFPDYVVVVTGHSLGASIATLTAIDLIESSVVSSSNMQLFTYGSPRIGNPTLATWISNKIIHSNRVTHCKDPVPHYPPGVKDCFLGLLCGTYQHITNEWYEDCNGGSLRSCSGAEDPTCAGQYNTLQTLSAFADHHTYLKVPIECPV